MLATNRVTRAHAVLSATVITIYAATTPSQGDDSQKSSAQQVSYYQHVRPIFQANCTGCHQPAKPRGKYVMTNFAKLLAGGESGDPAIVPGKPDESSLIEQITPVNGEAAMPQGKKPLAPAEIDLIKRWIAQGSIDDTPASANVRFDVEHPPVYTLPPVITSLDFSPNAGAPGLLAVAGFNEVLLHNADGSGLVARLVGMSQRIESVAFSPDGKLLAVTGGQPAGMGELQVWNVETRKLQFSLPLSFDTLRGVSWSPDGKLIAFGCPDKTVRAIEAATGREVLQQGAHEDWTLDTVFTKDGSHLVSVSNDRTAKLTEVATQRFIDNITSITPGALKGGIASVARHPTEDMIVAGGADGTPRLYRIFRASKRVIGDDANLIREFPPLRGRVNAVAMSRDGSRVAAGSSLDGTGHVRVYAYEFETTMPDDVAKIMTKVVTTRSPDEVRRVAEYHTKGVKPIAETTIADSGIYALAFHPDGKLLAAAGSDGKVRLLDAASGAVTKEFVPVPVDAMAVAAVADTREASGRRQPPDQPAHAGRSPDSASQEESLKPTDKLAALEVHPTQAKIESRYDTVQFLVTGKLETGELVDVTRIAQAAMTGNAAEISPTGLVRARANGPAKLTFSLAGKAAESAIEVGGMDGEYHPDYVRDVMPAISKLGCNAGTCHGANKGKGALKTSLRGNDPLFDFRAWTDELAARRVNLASPADSLILLKATAAAPHEGGQIMRPGEPYYEIVRAWVADRAKFNVQAPRVTGIEIFPKNPIVDRIGSRQQFRLVAAYSDGKSRDVTADAFIMSGNTEVAEADTTGLFTTVRRGESQIIARFEGSYTATTLTVMGDRSGFVWAEPDKHNFIDELVAAKWKLTKTASSAICTDAEFIRRVYLDLIGLPPTADEVRKFIADSRDTRTKRDELIDRLIGSPDYVEHWTNKWADLLQVNRKFLGVEGAQAFRQWIRDQVAGRTPYDQFARKVITASGSNRENPPASYFKIHRTPDEAMENTTHLFMGVRFSCNKCHDHPFERWAQDNYWELAGFFARVGLRKDAASGDRLIGKTDVDPGKPLFEIIYDREAGEVTHERYGTVAEPKFPFAVKTDAPDDAIRRERFARWLTSADNRYFARSYANRIWAYLMGVGLIEPIDDLRAGNPPTNPDLLDRLTKQFIDSGFNTQELVRTIARSRVYQLSIATNKWNDDDKINYSHAYAKRLPAEVLYDALHRVTGSASNLPGLPPGSRAATAPDSEVDDPSGFLARFGRPPRESACECERSSGMQFGPVMAMVTGPTVSGAITDPANDIAKLVAGETDDAKLVDSLFVRILNRSATQAEIDECVQVIRDMPGSHDRLIAESRDYETSIAPKVAEQEQARKAAIEKATAELAGYETEIAPREAELDKTQLAEITKAEVALKEFESKLTERIAAWEARPDKATQWVPLDPAELSATGPVVLVKQPDLSVLATDQNGLTHYRVVAHTDLVGIRAARLEVLADDRNPKKGPGRAPDGNFVLSEFTLAAAPKAQPDQAKSVKLINAQADFSQYGFDVATAIDGQVLDDGNGWAITPKIGVNHLASFETREPIGFDGGTTLTFTLTQKFHTGQHTIGRFRISVTTSPGPVLLDKISDAIAAVLAVPADKRNDEQKKALLEFFRSVEGDLKSLQQAVVVAKQPRPVDPKLQQLRDRLADASRPLPLDPKLEQLRAAVELSGKQLENPRLTAAQDIAWALINSPAFLFNR